MRNRILKFIELIKEAHEDDEQELNDLLLDLKDELINYEIHKGYFSREAINRGQSGETVLSILHNRPIYSSDKYCLCIEIKMNQLQSTIDVNRFGRKLYQDKKIFTIFNQLQQISERYDNCFLHINVGSSSYNPAIYLFILLDTEVDTGTTKLMQIYKEIQSRNSAAKSDFSNDTTIRLEGDSIIVRSREYSYTDRKFRGLIRGIDLSDFKIEKTVEQSVIKNAISRKTN